MSSPTTNHYKKSPNNNNTINNNNKNNNINNTENQETEPLLIKRSPEPRIMTTNVNGDKKSSALTVTSVSLPTTTSILTSTSVAPKKSGEFAEESLAHEKTKDTSVEKRAKLPTPPPPTKNVSFGELREDNYLEQAILPPPVQFVPKHRHTRKFLLLDI